MKFVHSLAVILVHFQDLISEQTKKIFAQILPNSNFVRGTVGVKKHSFIG